MRAGGLRIALVGGSGRVGGALTEALGERHDIRPIGRVEPGSESAAMLRAAFADAGIAVNAAGVAHVSREPTPADVARLVTVNVLLPLSLAEACLETKTPLVHISSSKAVGRDRSAYAWSKRAGDDLLVTSLSERFRTAGVPLVIVRPPALLFPPFDAGKLRWLRNLDRLPGGVTPKLRVPVVAPDRFVARLEELVVDAADGRARAGVSIVGADSFERGTLADVRTAMRQWHDSDRAG